MTLKFHILYSNPVSYVHTNIVIFCSHTTSTQIVFVSAEMPVFWIATETNSSVHGLHTDHRRRLSNLKNPTKRREFRYFHPMYR